MFPVHILLLHKIPTSFSAVYMVSRKVKVALYILVMPPHTLIFNKDDILGIYFLAYLKYLLFRLMHTTTYWQSTTSGNKLYHISLVYFHLQQQTKTNAQRLF